MSEAWRNVAPSLLTCHLLTVSWRGDGTDPARMLSRPLSPQLVPNNGAGGGGQRGCQGQTALWSAAPCTPLTGGPQLRPYIYILAQYCIKYIHLIFKSILSRTWPWKPFFTQRQ